MTDTVMMTREKLFEEAVLAKEAAQSSLTDERAANEAVVADFEAYMLEVRGILARYIHAGGVRALTVTTALAELEAELEAGWHKDEV